MKRVSVVGMMILLLGMSMAGCSQTENNRQKNVNEDGIQTHIQTTEHKDIAQNKTAEKEHQHDVAKQSQEVENPITGFCGNTVTTIYVGDTKYSFWGTGSVKITSMLLNLDYDPEKVCDCIPEYKMETDFCDAYEVSLTESYARCDRGQVELTQEQKEILEAIIHWAETADPEQNWDCPNVWGD